jgi:hypothetical protein
VAAVWQNKPEPSDERADGGAPSVTAVPDDQISYSSLSLHPLRAATRQMLDRSDLDEEATRISSSPWAARAAAPVRCPARETQ